MISYEEFVNLNNDEKWNLFLETCNKASGCNLKAGQRKTFLRNLNIEDYNRSGSYLQGFDFKNEYDKIVKLNEIIENSENKSKEKEENGIEITSYEKVTASNWNKKFYNSKVEGTYRVYLNNECCFITEETKEKLLTEMYKSKNLEKFTVLAKLLRDTKFGLKTLSEDEIIEILETAKDRIDEHFEQLEEKDEGEIKKFKIAVRNILNNDYFVRCLEKETIKEIADIIANEYFK